MKRRGASAPRPPALWARRVLVAVLWVLLVFCPLALSACERGDGATADGPEKTTAGSANEASSNTRSSASLQKRAEQAEVGWIAPPEEIPGLKQSLVGHGAGAAVVLTETNAEATEEIVVYLHGGLPFPPSVHAFALEHLRRPGRSLIFPVYRLAEDQQPRRFVANAVRGIEAALAELGRPEVPMSFVGEGLGGVLAFDLAAVAPSSSLASPEAIVAIAPGRNRPRMDLAGIPAATRLLVLYPPPLSRRAAARPLRAASSVPASQKQLRSLSPAVLSRAVSERLLERQVWGPVNRFLRGGNSIEG